VLGDKKLFRFEARKPDCNLLVWRKAFDFDTGEVDAAAFLFVIERGAACRKNAKRPTYNGVTGLVDGGFSAVGWVPASHG
jgi:hypothetical protein